ncbi:DNA (cytosine-5-)-methyltransferase [Cellulosimicrobium cellulans]|uniref:DNA (cytosine-5-)-methyltransferase n=1 Tax=Cellulosimicrobium cellulans TaxID=1710 RepID=UPI0036E135E6
MEDAAREVIDGRYSVVRRLGRGGMGDVCLAWDTRLRRHVAIKRVLGDRSGDSSFVARLLREARIAASLNHPAIATVHDAGVSRGDPRTGAVSDSPYVVMEYVDGQALSDLLADGGALPPHQAVAIVIHVLSALEHSHGVGVIHRDIKPDNVMLTRAGAVKVTDFGIARIDDDLATRLTRTGFQPETPAYMSPEQIQGLEVDARTDLYSTGCLLYELLTGRPVFADGFPLVYVKHLGETPLPPSARVPGLPEVLDVAVMQALAKNRDDRHPNARAFREMLEAAQPLLGASTAVTGDAPVAAATDSGSDGFDVGTGLDGRGRRVSGATRTPFRYVELFAGIGGLAAVLEALGGECVYAVENDQAAAKVYERNWGRSPLGDITRDANDVVMNVPTHDLLAARLPSHPFVRSGARGMDESRERLYWNVLKIIQAHHPTIVLLENARNLVGPRYRHEWDVIIQTLRDEGYRVSQTPTVFSPHLLPLERGGRPQMRERVYVTATYDPDGVLDGVEPGPPLPNHPLRGGEEWDLLQDLPLDFGAKAPGTDLTSSEVAWIDAWNDFILTLWPEVRRVNPDDELASLPEFPVWVDHWVTTDVLRGWIAGGHSPRRTPEGAERWDELPLWKQNFLIKNAEFYTRYKDHLDIWATRHDLGSFPPSRRKFEWQAQQTATLWECMIQFRPSGIRAKRPTHVSAPAVITPTPIIGPLRRRLSPREAARLQGFPDNFDFGNQPGAATHKQLGNSVSIGAVWNVLRAHAERDAALLRTTASGRSLLRALVDDAPSGPDELLPAAVALGQAKFRELPDHTQ